jgi:hypothetical protein
MRENIKGISINKNTYDGLVELKKKYKCTFSQLIEGFIPMPFFVSPINPALPVVKVKVMKKIPKQKYNYDNDLADWEANRCKSLNLKPMDPRKKVKATNGEYDDKTKAFLEETRSPYSKRKKVKST